jgi:outer membrane receptor protein involved in Fe transport
MKKPLLIFYFFLIAISAGFAQGVTTSTISGTVTDEKGEGLPGSNVVAIHEPSGTQYGTSVNPNGRFIIPNMRVGGPYKITISFVGYQTQTVSDVYLKLAETFALDAKLPEEGTELVELVVSDVRDKILSSERNGTVTNIGTGTIAALPTISRSINDMTRITPQATSTNNGAIGGGNYRQNYITVDGSEFNNTFGIGTNLPAGGSPISLDAVEEISINITPYDVRQSAFIGSAINAVTRSGTNNFSGSAYWFFRTDKQQGNDVRNNSPFIKQKLDEDTYGFRLAGPILQNKLFFFVNAERTRTIRPGQQNFAATGTKPFGSDPNVSRPTAEQLTTISTFLRENYGYETGPFDNYDFESENTKLTGRLDWNINQNHRVSLRYSQVESKSPSFLSSSTTGSNVVYGTGAGRLNSNALWFKNSNYYQDQNFYSLALEANSTFGKFSNTFRASYTNQNDPRSSDSQIFPFVDILDGSGVPFTSFGYEPFTYGNLRDVKSFSIVDFVYANFGIHNLTAGIQLDDQRTRNGFQRFGTGYYVFNSWDEFANGANPRDYAITYSLSPGFAQAFPEVGFRQYSIFLQDEVDVTDRLKLTAGIRFDLPTFPSVPEIKTHPLVASLSFEGNERVDTGVMPDTRVMFSPRFGFNYDVRGDRSVQVRGGTGIFTGRVPTVWIVAQSGDAGLLQFTQAFNGQTNTPGPFRKEPYRPDTPPAPGSAIPASVSAIDPDFKFPQTWKSSVAVDVKLPLGFIGTLEGIYNKDLNVALGRNPNLVAPQPLDVKDSQGDLIYPDRRPIYPRYNTDKYLNPLISGLRVAPGTTRDGNPVSSSNDASAFNPVVLDNASDGYYMSLTAKIEKQFDNGLSAFFAYTRSKSKVLYDGIGDQLLNTWSLTPIINTGNSPGMSYAGYVVPDRIVAGITYRREYLKHLGTNISLFLEGSSQGRFSYTYGADFNRDGQTNDLIYIPNDPSEITFTDFNYGTAASPKIYTAQQQSEIFFRYIEQDEYLSSRKGQYAERNGAKMPWRNQVDLRITQDIFTDLGKSRNTLQFTIDIFNFGNWLNKNWGAYDIVNAPSILVPTNQNSLVAGGNVKPTFRLQTDRNQPVSTTYRDNNSITSTYYMQFGIRYIFN